jgi:hypothetical protein
MGWLTYIIDHCTRIHKCNFVFHEFHTFIVFQCLSCLYYIVLAYFETSRGFEECHLLGCITMKTSNLSRGFVHNICNIV